MSKVNNKKKQNDVSERQWRCFSVFIVNFYFTPSSSASIVEFHPKIVSWAIYISIPPENINASKWVYPVLLLS